MTGRTSEFRSLHIRKNNDNVHGNSGSVYRDSVIATITDYIMDKIKENKSKPRPSSKAKF